MDMAAVRSVTRVADKDKEASGIEAECRRDVRKAEHREARKRSREDQTAERGGQEGAEKVPTNVGGHSIKHVTYKPNYYLKVRPKQN